jgi:hypothetical protein
VEGKDAVLAATAPTPAPRTLNDQITLGSTGRLHNIKRSSAGPSSLEVSSADQFGAMHRWFGCGFLVQLNGTHWCRHRQPGRRIGYGVSLFAVGRTGATKVLAARLSGWILIFLGALLLVEVMRRFFWGGAPVGTAMMSMALVNFVLNLFCLRLLKRHRGGDIIFKASAIFTSNDSIVNLAIILSGALVMWFESNVPDLLIGIVVSAIAIRGGKEILSEASGKQWVLQPPDFHEALAVDPIINQGIVDITPK